MKIILKTLLLATLLSCFISACGVGSFAAPTPTTVYDPCNAANIPLEVDKVHKLMREFDDASLLASNTPRDQLSLVISDLQRIHRAAEDQVAPPCLATLKQIQLAHMTTVINTLLAFLGGAGQDVLNTGTTMAREQHNQYAVEYARLLGLTVVAPVPQATP